MDSGTTTDDLNNLTKPIEENILLDLIKEIITEENDKLSSIVRCKVNRIISDNDLIHYSSLHRLSTANESTSTVLGLIQRTTTELTFDEQAELNQAIINKIQLKLPKLTTELDYVTKERLQNGDLRRKARRAHIKRFEESLEEKLNVLQEQENEKVELMMEWLNHRLQDVAQFSTDSTELHALKSRVLELKSKILYLQILQNVFTETNNSIKAYAEVHKDMKENIRDIEARIKSYKEIIENDRV